MALLLIHVSWCGWRTQAACSLVLQGKGNGEGGVKALVEQKGLLQISDPAALMDIVDSVLAANQKQLEQYRGGKTKLQGYFVG